MESYRISAWTECAKHFLSRANNSVDWKYLWNNYGEIQEFNQMWGSTSFKDLPSYIQRVNMEFNDLKKAREIHIERTKSTTSNARLNTAISRWIQSKQSKILPDQFVDLRIALETLYLNEGSSELKFRLSAYGAWHLGSNFTERKEIFSTLQTAYDLAQKLCIQVRLYIHKTIKIYFQLHKIFVVTVF